MALTFNILSWEKMLGRFILKGKCAFNFNENDAIVAFTSRKTRCKYVIVTLFMQ